MKKYILKYSMITFGTFLYGAAISLFLDPNNMAPGGVTGIAVILNRCIGLPTGTGILLLNIPILIAGLWRFGLKFLISTVYTTIMCSLFTGGLGAFEPLTENRLLAAIFGGGLMAVGLALVFRTGTTTGGMDIIVKFLRLRYRHLRTGRLFFFTDMAVVWTSLLVFGDLDTVLFASLAVVISTTVFDAVLYGGDEAKLIFLISDRSEIITKRFLQELEIGVTHLQGKGAYSSVKKEVILCVIRNFASPKAEEIVKEEDPGAFMIVCRAAEVYGERYKNILNEKL